MVNGAAALGILSGGSSNGTPSMSSLNLFQQINKNEAKLRENYFNRKDVQQSIETFKNKVSKMEDIDELIKDRKSLQFLLSSFDLDSEINNAGKIKAILKSDVNDQNSFANRLNDKRFAELAKFIDLNNRGLTNLRTASSQQTLIDKFLQNTFEKDVSGQNPNIAKAFHFLRNINNVSTTANLLGTLQLREIVTTALRLPPEIARQSIDKQISMVEAKFDVEKAVISDRGTGISNRRQSEYKDDIQAIEIAKSQVTSAESTLSTLEKQLKQARESLNLLPEIISPEGFNVDRIPIHQTAIKQLSEINGVNASAKAALSELDPILKELDASTQELLDVETQEDLDNIKERFAEAAAKVPDLIYHTARFKEPDAGSNINLFKPSGGVVDAGSPNSYTASRINYAYQDGTLGENPITTLSGALGTDPYTVQNGALGTDPYTVQSGTLGSDPYTVQSGTLGSNPFTVESSTLGSNPFTIKGGDLVVNPWRWFANHTPNLDSDNTAILKFRIPDHGLQAGDKITVSGTTNAFGADLNGTYTVHSVRTSDVIYIDVGVDLGSPPTTHEAAGGNSGTFVTNRVQVNHTGHPFSDGDTATFSGASSVGGQSLNSSFTVQNQSANAYEFLLGSPGSAAATGGGGSVTVNASDQVTVAHTGHPFSNGDTVTFSGGSSVGGASLNGSFTVANATANSYTVTSTSQGIAGTGGGGSVTVNASDQVTVAHTGHPFSNGDTVTFSGGSSVGGASLNGSFTVANATANSYTVTSTSQGIAGTGGGGSVTVNASDQVTVAHTGHPFSNGDTVTFSGGSSVGGASLNGSFTVANATANSYTVTSTSQGIAGTGGGGSVTVNASDQVTVAHTGHPFSNGDTVTFSGGSSVGGASLNGSFTVANATANSYTVTSTSQGIAGTGGGGSVTVNASDQVTVAQEDHLFSAGDFVTLSDVASVGGLNLTGTFEIASVTDDAYVITVGSQAIAGQTGGGSSATYGHTLGPNPFSTTSGSAVVSVADNNHGLSVGDVVLFDNSSAVGGLDLNAAFRVSSVTDANNYTITATSTATSTVGGGGGNGVSLTLPELASVIDEKNSNIIAQNKDMATFVSKIASAAATIAGTTLANVVSDTGSAKSDLSDANAEFRQARGVVNANSNSFTSQTNSITFAATLNTTELTKGRESILDAISRLEKIAASLKSIDRYATETFSSDNAASYAAARADVVSLLDNAGKVVGSTSGSLASDPFQTQSGNNQVTVAQTDHGLAIGDTVSFSGASSVGGLDLNASFTVTNVTDANTYTITASTNASANATGGGASVSFLGSPSATLDNLLAVSGSKTYRIRDGVDQFIASNPGLDDIDASGPYALNDNTRLNSLLPSTLTSGNQASAASGNATFLESVKTAVKQLQRDLPVFDFVINTADPLGAVDAQVTNIKDNIDKIFNEGNNRGLNLIDTSARDLSLALGSVGKKITISAQNQVKDNLKEAIENYTYSALDGGQSGNLGADPFTTVAGDTSILVSHTTHGFTVGEYVQFANGDNVGGLNLDTTFQITSVPNDNSYTITASTAANSSTTGGGGSVGFKTIPTARHKFLFDAHFDVSRSFSKLRTERVRLNVEEALLRAEFNKPMEVESQFLKPLKNTDYAVKFIEKYLLMKDMEATGVAFRPTNNNALALNLIKSINPNTGIGLSVNMLR